MLFVRTLTSLVGHHEVTAHWGSARGPAWIAQLLTQEAAAAEGTFPSTRIVVLAHSTQRAIVITSHRPSTETVRYQVNPGGVGRHRERTGATMRERWPRRGLFAEGWLDFFAGDAEGSTGTTA